MQSTATYVTGDSPPANDADDSRGVDLQPLGGPPKLPVREPSAPPPDDALNNHDKLGGQELGGQDDGAMDVDEGPQPMEIERGGGMEVDADEPDTAHEPVIEPDATTGSASKSAHEEAREQNIAANKALRLQLGIDDALNELRQLESGAKVTTASKKAAKKNEAAKKKAAKAAAAKTGAKGGAAPKRGAKGRKSNSEAVSSPSQVEGDDASDVETHQESTTAPSLPDRDPKPPPMPNNPSSTPNPSSPESTPAVDAKLALATPKQKEWLVPALGALTRVFGPVCTGDVLDLWLQFEILMGYQDMQKIRLTAQGRPWQIKDWMSRHRRYDKPPPIDAVAAYGTSWKVWWAAQQPECRIDGESSWPLRREVDKTEAEWSGLFKGGENGLFMALLSASWWMAKAEGADRDACVHVVEDLRWVFEQLIEVLKARDGVDEAEEKEEPPRKRYAG